MKWFVQVINPPTDSGSVPTLLVHLEKARYLFNCGEGTQRLFNENTVKISKLKTIFSTQNSWSHIGGLPGLLLTLGSIGITNLNVYGPKNIDKTLDATRHFTQQAAVSFNSKIFDSNSPVYSDDSLSTFPDSTTTIHPIIYPTIKKKILLLALFALALMSQKNLTLKIAISLGLKPGPQFKELVAGKSIIAPNGNEIFPHQVLFDSKPRGAFILVECPNEDSIPFIISNKNFSQFFNSSSSNSEKSTDDSNLDSTTHSNNEYFTNLYKDFPEYSDNSQVIPKIDDCSIKFIFHSLGPNVLRNASYLNWMQKFPKNVAHIISSKEYCGNVNPFVQHSDLSLQLGQIDPQVFPFPNYNNVPIAKLTDIDCIKNGLLPKVCLAQFNLKMEIEPDFKINASDVIHYNNYDQTLFNFRRKVMDNPMYKNFFSKLSDPTALQTGSINKPNAAISNSINNSAKTSSDNPGKFDFLISTLGTGSAIPSCKRNVSSNLLYIPSHGFVLLDAGEGTTCQIKRLLGTNSSPRKNRFSNSTYETFLENLKLVHISHNHADHHLGLAQLLEDWYAHNFSSGSNSGDEIDMDINNKKLFIICPGKFESFLSEISEFLNIGFNKLVIIRAREFIIPFFDLPRTGLVADSGIGGLPIENAQSQKQSVHQGPNVFHDQSKAQANRQFVHQGQATQYDKSQYQMRAKETEKKIVQLYESLGLKSIYTCDVEHYGNCMGISITHNSGFQIIYSGDTRPSVNLVKLAYYLRVEHGQNLTLLLHEATLYDELLEDAIKKRHSTVSEAIGVSLAMRAENSIFTHFSQRHVGIPSFNAETVKRVNFSNFGSIVDLIGSVYSQPILDSKMSEHGIIAGKLSVNGTSSHGYTDTSRGSAGDGKATECTAGTESNRCKTAQVANLDKASHYIPFVCEPCDKASQQISTESLNGCEISIPESNRSDLENLIESELNKFKCAFAFDMAVFSLDDVVNYNQFVDKMNVLFYEETKEMDGLVSEQNGLSSSCCSDEMDGDKANTNKKRKNSS
ncbi:Ribonuclease Z [Smittium culicis]|uniref:ribonuclease Z n=1 Tax=Smittium culicis TaxID=133412 RepID=A0A1R1WZ00_9FUNG|nr:Ribonuclease Z [Smittium culicis]